jgi:hypothetical protein
MLWKRRPLRRGRPLGADRALSTISMRAPGGSSSDPIPHILRGISLKVKDLRMFVNSTDLCASQRRANARFEGQSGRGLEARPVVSAGCKTAKKKDKR